jgi:hypothetical protein
MAKDNHLFWGRIPDRLRNAGVRVYLGNTDSWCGISHAEIIDIKRRKISGVDVPSEYVKIIDKLALLGF